MCLLQWLGEGDIGHIAARVSQTARFADADTVRRLLIPCSAAGRCLKDLERLDRHHCRAELLPHLDDDTERVAYLCHCIGLLLNRLFVPTATTTGALLSTSDPDHSLARSNTLCGPALHRMVRMVLQKISNVVRRHTTIALAGNRTGPLANTLLRDVDVGNEEADRRAEAVVKRWMISLMNNGRTLPPCVQAHPKICVISPLHIYIYIVFFKCLQ